MCLPIKARVSASKKPAGVNRRVLKFRSCDTYETHGSFKVLVAPLIGATGDPETRPAGREPAGLLCRAVRLRSSTGCSCDLGDNGIAASKVGTRQVSL